MKRPRRPPPEHTPHTETEPGPAGRAELRRHRPCRGNEAPAPAHGGPEGMRPQDALRRRRGTAARAQDPAHRAQPGRCSPARDSKWVGFFLRIQYFRGKKKCEGISVLERTLRPVQAGSSSSRAPGQARQPSVPHPGKSWGHDDPAVSPSSAGPPARGAVGHARFPQTPTCPGGTGARTQAKGTPTLPAGGQGLAEQLRCPSPPASLVGAAVRATSETGKARAASSPC